MRGFLLKRTLDTKKNNQNYQKKFPRKPHSMLRMEFSARFIAILKQER